MATDKKKRLPVLSSGSGDADPEPDRPPWQWVGFGAVLLLATFLPLTYVASLLVRRFTSDLGETPQAIAEATASMSRADYARSILSVAGPPALSLVLSSLATGFVMGKWGAKGVGPRQAAWAGGLVSVGLWILTWVTIGRVPVSSLALVLLCAVPACVVGVRLGARKRGGAH